VWPNGRPSFRVPQRGFPFFDRASASSLGLFTETVDKTVDKLSSSAIDGLNSTKTVIDQKTYINIKSYKNNMIGRFPAN
jgi:hypothetical protein